MLYNRGMKSLMGNEQIIIKKQIGLNRVIIAKAENASDLHPIWTTLVDVYSSGFADGMKS